MYKIIAAINSMISNQQLITQAVRNENEVFFVYDGRFKWSIAKHEGEHFLLHYYPGNEPLSFLAALPGEAWTEVDFVTYSTKELKTKEALESFSELYRIVQSKLYNIDDVLDYIIKTAA